MSVDSIMIFRPSLAFNHEKKDPTVNKICFYVWPLTHSKRAIYLPWLGYLFLSSLQTILASIHFPIR